MATSVCVVDDSEWFFDQSEDVATAFLRLYNMQKDRNAGLLKKSPILVTQPKAAVVAMQTVEEPFVEPAPSQATMDVAKNLRQMGDSIEAEIDRELTSELSKGPVLEMGLEQFTTTCKNVLRTCSSKITNAWQRAFVVYYSMMRVTGELRNTENLPPLLLEQRTVNVTRFVGPVMQDLGLDEWATSRDGMFPPSDTAV